MRSHITQRFHRRVRHTARAIGVSLLASGCAVGLDSPKPVLSARDPLAISPAIVCNQLPTTLDIRGQHFVPVPVDVPEPSRLLLPTFTLQQSALLDGSKADQVTLVYSGDPDSSLNATALRWLGESHMQAALESGRLTQGVYDARVVNPDGHVATAAAALTVVDRPSFAAQAELVLCDSRAEQALVIQGSGFLRVADALPVLRVDGRDGVLTVSELSECSALSAPGGSAAVCNRAAVTVTDPLEPGIHDAELVNPSPAACQTEAKLRLRVVPGPQLESNPIESVCTREQTRVVVVRGKGFLEVSGALPSATVAGKEASVVALDDCEPATGAQRSCKKLQLELPVGGLGALAGSATLVVSNPAPASCSVSASLQLRDLLPSGGGGPEPCSER